MVKILATADWQLGKAISGAGSKSPIFREQLFLTAERIVKEVAIENNADIGVGYDGDGDRSICCDETGTVFWGDKSGTLVGEHLIQKGIKSPIVTTIATSQIIEKIASKYDVEVYRTKVGSVDVSHKMIELDSKFGFEENGGCLYSPHVRSGSV